MAKKNLAPLVTKSQQGDREALNQLMQECYETLFYYAYNTVKNEDLAADITQDSCIEIINTLNKLRDPNAFHTWAGRIVYHKCAAHYRNVKDEAALDADDDGQTILDRLPDENRGNLPEQVQEDKEFKALIWQMLDSLPAEQRQAMMLYYLENMSVGEIAEIQGKTPGTIKSRLNYGRKAVIAQVEAYEKKNGVRLHSLAPLPLLLYFLFRENMDQVSKSAPVGATVTAATAASTAAGAAGTGLFIKLLTGVAAAVLVLGGVVGGIALSQNGSKNSQTGGVQDSQTSGTQHTHDFTAGYRILPDGHEGVCQCGESATQAHTYDQGKCVCGDRKASEGLRIKKYSTHCAVEGIGDCADTYVVIPAYYEGLPVLEIAKSAFQDCSSMTGIYIPETVTTIRQWAFYNCENLAAVHFSEGLTKMEDLVFIWCQSLTEITFPDSLSQMGHSIFNECVNLKYVKLPTSLTVLERGVFSNCDSLETVVFPTGITSVGDKLFWHCTELSRLQFAGTTAQWAAIDKGFELTTNGKFTNWCTDTGDFTVTCTNGTLSKEESQ